jgi:hypothetical protein
MGADYSLRPGESNAGAGPSKPCKDDNAAILAAMFAAMSAAVFLPRG